MEQEVDMSVYIKGRKPPNSCDDCWVSDCPNDEHIDGYRMMDRPTYCPLIPVPDHGRLIDADAMLNEYYSGSNDGEYIEKAGVITPLLVERLPTIIPADKEDI